MKTFRVQNTLVAQIYPETKRSGLQLVIGKLSLPTIENENSVRSQYFQYFATFASQKNRKWRKNWKNFGNSVGSDQSLVQ